MSAVEINYDEAIAFKALDKPKRYKVFFGGRGGAKSWQIAQALLIRAASEPTRILCTREIQGSIKESVHKLLSTTIDRLGLSSFFDVLEAEIRGKNGSSIIFEGLKHNITKIKSMEGIDIVWAEEAESVTETSWDVLLPTIRKAGSEIWVSFNPHDELDNTYQRFVVPHKDEIDKYGFFEDAQTYVRKVNFEDNPWFTEELQAQMEDCKRTNYRKWLHIWCGECNADYADSIIQPEWVEAAIDAHKKLNFKPCGKRQAGFDPADEGEDAKAVVTRHGVLINKIKSWKDGDLDDAVSYALKIVKQQHCRLLTYDVVGIGAGVKLALKRLDTPELVTAAYTGAGVTDGESLYEDDLKNEDVFRNGRAQWWWYLRDRFEKTYQAVEKGRYINPDDLISLDSTLEELPRLKSELCKVRRKRGQTAYIQIESKQDMKKRGVQSPNIADALVMAFFTDAKQDRQQFVTRRAVQVSEGGWT